MANIAVLLKQEINRLVRKELKPQAEALRKAHARHRGEIAELKRRLGALEQQLKASSRRNRLPDMDAATPEAGRPLRFSADGLRKHRNRLGLSAAELGALLGVSLPTIYNWEGAKTRPSPAQIARIAQLRSMGKREVQARLASTKA